MVKSAGLIEKIKHEKFEPLAEIFPGIFFMQRSYLFRKHQPETMNFKCMFIDHIANDAHYLGEKSNHKMWDGVLTKKMDFALE